MTGHAPLERDRSGNGWQQLKERVGRGVLATGWAGGAGLALLVLAAGLGLRAESLHDSRRAALAAERAELLRQQAEPRRTEDGRTRLDAYYDAFPKAVELPGRLQRVSELASAHALRLPRTDYRSTLETGSPLLAVGLVIPVEASFADIYAWLDALLQEMPEVALESLVVRREDPGSDVVEADVRLQLYLRGRS